MELPGVAAQEYLVRRSRTCCFLLGMVARASTMVQAACLAAWVAGVNSTWAQAGKGRSHRWAHMNL